MAAPPANLSADAETLRAAVKDIHGPVVVCAHSYGGAVASQALSGLSNIVHLVYLAAFAWARGESLSGMTGHIPPPWHDVRGDGFVHALTPEKIFFNDVPAEPARDAVAKLRPHTHAAFTEKAHRDVLGNPSHHLRRLHEGPGYSTGRPTAASDANRRGRARDRDIASTIPLTSGPGDRSPARGGRRHRGVADVRTRGSRIPEP